ncbi:MAG: glycosylase [Pseudomonadota bacterium]|jgi:predicted GH43/DUF377 family glycosyl hydrolase|nr:glycosylase [Pseudomonadota bacterium]
MRWNKLGRVFNPEEHQTAWMKYFSQCVSTLILEDVVRVYFSCRPEPDEGGQISYTTFVEFDRADLFKIKHVAKQPVMPLGKRGCFDEFAIYPTSVLKEVDQIKLYYAGWYRTQSVPFNTSIGLAISEDGGLTFRRIGDGPVLAPCIDEPFVISGPKIRKFGDLYYLFYIAGKQWINHKGRQEIVYKNRLATSKDGINWVRYGQDITPDSLELNECQAGPDVFYKDGKYHMYFVYRYALDFRDDPERGYRIGYAHSDDLFSWTRDDANAGITYSNEGWDSKMAHYPHVFELDGKWFMYYNGNDFGKYGFGLAVLDE